MIKTITKATDFGIAVQKAMIDRRINQKQIIEDIRNDTGLYFDSSYFNKILTGKLNTPKIVASIKKILELT